ncbi:uncharacterized protein LOC110990640 [Acanthaster planci]|uniref:Uncharacterized protein LOC110990640 n=1 Tax=Acanthaster planci TaxID=133434 RepID=A0A8B8A0Y1_ACAPL|nr:uncharacterized protein LOC110990640 [Acanthaster planci]
MRHQQHDVIADNLFAESIPFSFPDEINRGVTQQLDEYEKHQQLTWHKGTIPHNEVWVKVGGDKGGGTFKQMIQVGNVERPNSLRHTVVVCAFAAGDTSDNLKTGLQRFRQQVAALQSSTWKSHNIRLFMFGDYEYLCRVYGITGAGGRHCCLYCSINKDYIRLPRGERPPSQQRTLQSLNQDLHRFKAAGSNISKAKHFNNVIDEPMVAIPLTQVCPPGLHISLGLYLKHFNSFKGACHDLDMQAAAVLTEKDQDDHDAPALGSGYQKLISVLKVARKLEQQAEALDEEFKLMEDQLTDTILTSEEGSANMQDYITATTGLMQQREQLLAEAATLRKKAALKPGQGPLAGQLDITLQEFRVQR